MFKILLIILIAGGAFAYSKFGKVELPQNLSQVSGIVNKYFPNAATQSAVLGAKAKNESLILVIEATKKLKPDEFKSLQQFICEPVNNKK